MKKSILIPFLFMGLLAFASCKGTSENKSTTATDTVQAEKPQSGTIHLTLIEAVYPLVTLFFFSLGVEIGRAHV